MTALAIFLVGLVCVLLWMCLLAPLILRLFGVPVTFAVWRLDRRNQQLTRMQYVWSFGVVEWGIGMFFFFTVSDYLEWKMLGYRLSYRTPKQIIMELVTCMAIGLLLGFWSARDRNRTDVSGQ